MEVRYIGSQGDPDFIKQYGISFERKGDWVTVPDDHPFASKFRGNPFFDVKGRKDAELTAQKSSENEDGPLPKPVKVPTDVDQTIDQPAADQGADAKKK